MKTSVPSFILLLSYLPFASTLTAQSPKLVIPVGHAGKINSMVTSPDGARILTTSTDETAKLWDAFTGRLLTEFKQTDYGPHAKDFNNRPSANHRTIHDGAFNKEGRKIVIASGDQTLKVWDIYSGELLYNLKGGDKAILGAGFLKDGRLFSCTETETTVRVAASDKVTHTFPGRFHNGWTPLSHGEKMIATELPGFVIAVWDIETGDKISELKGHTEIIQSLSFDKTDSVVVTGGYDGSVRTWDPRTGRMLTKLDLKDERIEKVSFSGPGQVTIISAETLNNRSTGWTMRSGQLLIRYWENSKDRVVKKIHTGLNDVGIVTLGKDPNTLIYCQRDKAEGKIYDLAAKRVRVKLSGQDQRSFAGIFDTKGERIIIASGKGVIKFWDINTGKVENSGLEDTSGFWASYIDNTGTYIATLFKDSTLTLRNLLNKKLIGSIRIEHYRNAIVGFSRDARQMLTSSGTNELMVWHTDSMKLLRRINTNDENIFSASFSPDGTKVATTFWHGHSKVWDARTGELLTTIGEPSFLDYSASFSPDGEKILITSQNNFATVCHAATGEILYQIKGHKDIVRTAVFSPDGKTILTGSADNTARIWDAQSGSQLLLLEGHKADLSAAVFNPSGTIVLTKSDDNTHKLWDAATGKQICTFILIDSIDHIILHSSGYYMSTRTAAKTLHYVDKYLRVISFEQLDISYNRPDKVLELMGSTDTALIKSYHKAWEKRIKKLDIDTTQLGAGYSVPECDFANRDSISYEQKTGTLSLHIKGRDSTYKLDRFNIWVNESPLFGQRGISIRKKSSHGIDTTISIQLSQGENRIETSITNSNGTESYRMPVYVNYIPAVKQKEALRFIGIGIDQYSDPGHDLEYSVKDIRDLAVTLKKKYKKNITIDTLFNSRVTPGEIQKLKLKMQETSVNDRVIVSYSGHGLLSKEFDYYLGTYSINFDKPEENGLPYDELENLLDSIPARKKLLLIDACHSGEVDKEEMARITAAKDTLSKQGAKGGKARFTGKITVGMKNSFELMRFLFVNVGKSTGATIISAAAGTEFALERGDLKNGVFTYSILEAMNKYQAMKISELKKIVGERVEQLTNGLQKPTSRNEMIVVDWSLW